MVTEIVSKENVLKQDSAGRHKHSNFPLGYPKAQTMRFAEYAPVHAMNIVPDDGPVNINLPSDIRSYTLKAPLMGSSMRVKQDGFLVTKECMLPRAAEYLIKNPKRGDDAPEDADTVIYGFRKIMYDIFTNWINEMDTNLATILEQDLSAYVDDGFTTALFKLLILMETYYSSGSLLWNMDFSTEDQFHWNGTTRKNRTNFGQWFDTIITKLVQGKTTDYLGTITFHGTETYTIYPTEQPDGKAIGLRTALCMMRDDMDFTTTWNITKTLGDEIYTKEMWDWLDISIVEIDDTKVPFNYEKLIAYQIVCAHFYSNDNVDYIYNAQLWRDNMETIIFDEYEQNYFTINGIKIPYDAISGNYFKTILEDYILNIGKPWTAKQLNYYINIFSYKRSLRDVDYFTGARTQPLAVGNVDVAVEDSKVNVIDITKNIQKQRFLNAVNRAKNGLAGYIKEIFGIEQKQDYHNPFWLFHTTDFIGTPETENTASEQYEKPLAITSQFRASSSNKVFNFHTDRYGVVIVMRYFDIPRLYYRGINRHFFIANRFDNFIPEMQYIGDQPIYSDELDNTVPHIESDESENYFGYTGQNMDFKTNVGRACGGFVHNLPGYCFLADHNRTMKEAPVIGPDYIRSYQTELDEFYNSLTGYSLETYFHFLCLTGISINASRPMAYNPQILK